MNTITSTISSGWDLLNFNPISRTITHILAARTLINDNSLASTRKNYLKKVDVFITESIKSAKDPTIPESTKVSKDVKTKIRSWIRQTGVDPKKIKLIVKEKLPGDSPYGSVGSLKYNKKCIIYISSDKYKQLEGKSELLKVAKFPLLHELGHIANDDWGDIGIRMEQIKGISKIVSYTLFTCGLAYSGWGAVSSTSLGAMSSFVVDKIYDYTIANYFRKRNEVKADEFAARDREACEGGIQGFENDPKKSDSTSSDITDHHPIINQEDNSIQPNQHNVIPVTHSDTPEDKASVTIQKYIRGYLARRPLLPNNLYPQYHAQCEKAKGPESSSMPKAQGGDTIAYLPKEMPEVVLKNSGRKDAIKRFHQMQEVRSILDSQNSSNLIIPKASLCGNFLVEQRLPINADSYHNMGLYLSQPQLFDEAVREMTRLFSKIYVSDLVSFQPNPLGHIEGVGDFIRYDNLPLYIVEKNGKKEGKIGLIDLEHIQNSPSSHGLETLVRIFPLHLDIIEEEAKNLKMKINHSSLEAAADKGKKYLQVGYSDHLKWLQNKDISTKVVPQPFQVSTERVNQLTGLIEKELLKLNQGVNDCFIKRKFLEEYGKPLKDFFTGNPEDIAKELALSISPLIINNLKNQIEENQSKQLSKISGQHMTESEMVNLRSPVIKRKKLYKGVDKLINRSSKINFSKNNKKFGINNYVEHINIAEQLTYVVIQELVKGDELFFFDPGYYGANISWIRL